MITLLAIFLSYLVGSISSAILICKLFGLPDPRKEGSQNPGTTNVLRIGGKKAAIFTLIGDVVKGVIPVVIAKACGLSSSLVSLVALAAFLGHLYPIYFKFRGGKGVATAFGCLIALSWPLGILLAATWIFVAVLFRYSSLAALIAALFAPFYGWYFTNAYDTGIITFISLLLFVRHGSNIQKLIQGKENKIGE